MVRTVTQNPNVVQQAAQRRRGGVNQANRRAATSQYKYSVNKSLGNARSHPANGPAAKQSAEEAANNAIYTRQWLNEADKEKAPFPEDVLKTSFDPERLATLVETVKKATDDEVNGSNRLLADDYVYSVQITSHRAPHVPMHLSRILLPHSLETADSDICIFVKDLKRGRKLDHEPTVKHYEQLLRTKKIDRSITVIPINQLYNEFATFELRRKLTYLYDRFLVDKSVAAHVNAFLGAKLLNKGRTAIPIDLGADDLSAEIEQALRIVFYKHVNNGITQTVQVGRHSMSNGDIAGNIVELVGRLAVLHPGGSKNVYKLFLKPNVNVSVAVPLYVDLAKPKLETPVAVGPREKALSAAAETASAVLDNFDINKAGAVVAKSEKTATDVAAGLDVTMDDGSEPAAVEAPPAPVVASTPAPKPRTAAAKKGNSAAPLAASPIAEEQLNNVILKNLKKLVPKLMANVGGGQQLQQNTGRVQKNQPQQNNQQNNQQPKQQRQQNNQQQHLQQQPQQQRQNNMNQQRQNNNQQLQQQQVGGYGGQQQQQLPQQQRINPNQQNNRRNNQNQGGGGYQQNNLGGGNANMGNSNMGGGGYMQQQQQPRNNNLGGGLNNYGGGNNNQRALGGGIGAGMGVGLGQQNQRNFNNGNLGGGGGGYGNNMGGGGGGNWSIAGGLNNGPWGQSGQF